MLIHRDKIENAANACLHSLKTSRLEICMKKAAQLLDRDEKFCKKIKNFPCLKLLAQPLSYEEAMIRVWNEEDLSFLYGQQETRVNELLYILKAVDDTYIELTQKETIFVGKWV